MKRQLFFVFSAVCFALACSQNKNIESSNPAPGSDTSGKKIIPWVTTGDENLLLKQQAAVSLNPGSGDNAIIVDTSETFQSMDGFGYTLTGGSAHVINKMPSDARSNLLRELFSGDENSVRINFLRLSIGASDLNDSVFTYDDMPAGETDTALANFSLQKDSGLLRLLKDILAIQPGIQLMATPWTPPVWMKTNGNSVGGSLNPDYYSVYARYFVKYIQEMKNMGITVHAITPQNEPLHPGNNPSLLMLSEQQADFIKNHLGPAFESAGLETKIVVYDHNCDRPDYPLTILNDAAAKKYVDGSAFHLYAGDISAMSQVRQAHPDKNIYFTEQYTAIDGKFEGDLEWHVKNLLIGAPLNWSKTVLEWNLANDVSYGPHTPGGCTTCKGALTIDGGAVKRNVAYYIIAHASKFVPYGSKRIASSGTSLPNVAYKTPEGKVVVIVLNEGSEAANFRITIGNQSARVNLPGSSVGTFVEP
jgi:glucosylceramidase